MSRDIRPAKDCLPRVLALTVLLSLGGFSGCNRMITPRHAQLGKDADAKAAEGNYSEAINLYEAALDGRADSAEMHYKLALIYDDKMNDPLNAIHHFKRFLTFEPSGKRADEVKASIKRDELSLTTSLSGDSMVPRSEVVRLRNENLSLRKQIVDRWAAEKSQPVSAKSDSRKNRLSEKIKRTGKERTYTVRSGDTLASISRKFYHSSARWQRIMDANSDVLTKPGDLKPGQTLVIP